ncbi:phosphatidic acid phosphatase [Sediminicola sp. YIK13]|uniref:phosphatase PAP2 family protein n=1 Tax=Sediminicola sp. YIK13 TaxID=1453352 RepID=UPI00071FF756|nr:phosphatase PAP2 family protein [Sediminicola sp. YIK13]ALM06465.1 phosphatidic acid phosphatase [Sediminicola sp. YIK13]
MLEKIAEWDRNIFIYLNSLGIEDYDVFWSIVTNISSWTPLFVLFFILIWVRYPKKEAFFMTLTVLVLVGFILGITDLTKEFVARLRPNNNEEINTVIRILRSPTGYSFFSGHASSSFSITTLVFLFLRPKYKWVWVFYLWPLLFTFSRIYVGVHYPVDILVGAMVGTFSALLFYKLHQRFIIPYLASTRPL